MNITLTQELEELIDEKIKSGLYHSPTEIVSEALHLLKERDLLREIRRAELRKEIQKGIDDIREGRYRTYDAGDDIANELINEFQEELSRKE